MYIFGKFLKKNKNIHFALKAIYGLGNFQIKILCNKSQIGFNCKINQLSQNQVILLCRIIEQKKFLVESQLKNIVNSDVNRLIHIRCFSYRFYNKR